MLTAINNNQQNINFQQKVKLSERRKQFSEFLRNKGINPKYAMSGAVSTAAGGAATSILAPNLISSPEAGKLGIIGALCSTGGMTIPFLLNKKKSVKNQNDVTLTAELIKARDEAKEWKAEAGYEWINPGDDTDYRVRKV